MSTTTLADPIDGAELKLMILERVRRALDRDSTLANDIAYAGFRLDFEIKLVYKRATTATTMVWGGESGGAEPILPGDVVGDEMGVDKLADHYETDSPNTAREAHDLPIPVMVKTATGVERRKIHVNPRPVK